MIVYIILFWLGLFINESESRSMEDVNNVLDIVKDDNFYGEVIILVDLFVDGMFLIYYFLLFFLGNNCLVCFVLLL